MSVAFRGRLAIGRISTYEETDLDLFPNFEGDLTLQVLKKVTVKTVYNMVNVNVRNEVNVHFRSIDVVEGVVLGQNCNADKAGSAFYNGI